MSAPRRADARSLEKQLRSRIRGEVRFSEGDRRLYAADASKYRHMPIGVVIPRDVEDIVIAMEAAREHGAPVTARGGGTSLAGQGSNHSLIIDTSKYVNRVLEVDPARRQARVEPGVILDDLRAQAERHGLTFGPDPATHNHCTLGGMIGNNSCGVHSMMAGRTADNVEEMHVLTYDGLRLRVGPTSPREREQIVSEGGRRGEIYRALQEIVDRNAGLIRTRYPHIPRRVSGYNLDELLPENGFQLARALVGSESTCVFVLDATVRLVPNPRRRALLVLGYPDVYAAADDIPNVLEYEPIGLEGVDQQLTGFMRKKHLHANDLSLLPEGGGWLLVEFGGDDEKQASERARAARSGLTGHGHASSARLYTDERQKKIWQIRESGLGATAFVPGERPAWDGWEDSAVPPEKLGEYLRRLRTLFHVYGYHGSLYGHFGQGCVHTRIDFGIETRPGLDRYLGFTDEAADLVVSLGGSLSGEHGDGQSRGPLLVKMFGPELMEAFRRYKAIWDPEGAMNPGRVVDARGRDQDLRLGVDYHPKRPQTHFQFPEDKGSFAHATMRCVGVGKCRRLDGGVMCPSFMATREEKDTTRGRAHLLFEMLRGDGQGPEPDWRNHAAREALDLCLACKGCKGECPVNVDMATYKAEFLSHYYSGLRLRPLAAYSMGLIRWWAELAGFAPRLANFFTQHQPWRGLAQIAGGIAPERRMPPFGRQSFRRWFHERSRSRARHAGTGRPRVWLWPDTFNDFFRPETARAAVRVLEAAGYEVDLPPPRLCCGRPLYDFGMLDAARRLLLRALAGCRPAFESGTPILVLEPSCLSVFRDEAANLLPGDPDVHRFIQLSRTLSEFLDERLGERAPFRLPRRALVQPHCHQRAVLGFTSDEKVMGRLGLDFQVPDTGCCGMAGSFGFERRHYQISMAIGERVLLPAVREADAQTLILADGFSCREQIEQGTGRHALHLAEALELALAPPQDAPRRPSSSLAPHEGAKSDREVPVFHRSRRS